MVAVTEAVGVLESAKALSAEIAARAEEGEVERTMPGDLVAKITDAGLFGLGLPRVLGGFELEPAQIIEVIEELSCADGSAGWTVLIGNNTAFLAWLDPTVARELIGTEERFASTAMFSPTGVAVPTGSGAFELNGRWQFSSGCMHARWLQTGMFVHEDGQPRILPSGRPDMRIAVVPRADVEIVDTWNVAGLRGTGSHEVAISDAIVPEALTSSPFFEPARHDGPLWRIPFYTLAGIFLAGFPLGVARRALDEFVAVAPTKSRLMAGETLAHDAAVQIEVARAEGMVDSARTLVLDALDDIWDKALFGDSPTLEQRARFLLAMQHAMFASTWAVDTVFRLAGAHAAYSSNPLQRCFRDIHIGAQHQFFSPGALNRYARLRFGIEQPTFMI